MNWKKSIAVALSAIAVMAMVGWLWFQYCN